MFTESELETVLHEWESVTGSDPQVYLHSEGRELWHVDARNGKKFFLKRLGPWRNLPLVNEARILCYLRSHGVPVATFIPTDRSELHAGAVEDSFVLVPELESATFLPRDLLAIEPGIGAAVARLHIRLASYPGSADSYEERMLENLQGDLNLPADLKVRFAAIRDEMSATLTDLPRQLIHGDLTPENIILKSPGEVSGFIDFEHLPIGPRIWDVAKYCSRRFRTSCFGPNSWNDDDRLRHVSAFLHGYHQVNPLERPEWEALPAAIAAGNILEVSYFRDIASGKLQRRRLPDHNEVLADALEAATWQLENYGHVRARILEAYA